MQRVHMIHSEDLCAFIAFRLIVLVQVILVREVAHVKHLERSQRISREITYFLPYSSCCISGSPNMSQCGAFATCGTSVTFRVTYKLNRVIC